MVMPFVRLLAIYGVVILLVVGFFQRDRIKELVGFPQQSATIENDEEMAVAPETAPLARPAELVTAADPKVELQSTEIEVTDDVPTEEEAVEIATQTPTSRTDLTAGLDNARKAYWGGDMRQAEDLYLALIKENPQSADASGEFANLLYAQRRYPEAAEHYFETAKILLSDGNSRQVLPIIRTLQYIAPEKAAALQAIASN